MLNILVPTDFSELAKMTVRYAIDLANELEGRVILFHVVTVRKPVKVSMSERTRSLEEDLLKFANEDLKKLLADMCGEVAPVYNPRVSVVRSTEFAKAVKREVKKVDAGLVIMGTHGASGLKKTVVGSNTASVIENSDVPVLAVPAKAKYKSLKEIVYACDMKQPGRELKAVLSLVKNLDPVIHIVHVASRGADVDEIERDLETVINKVSYDKLCSVVLVDRSVEGAIDQYISVNKAGLLLMFTHKLTFYEKLFDKSMTRKMAFQSMVPLLAFKSGKR